MKNRKYVVCRDNIYVGELIKTDDIYQYERDGKKELISGAYYSLRSILFVPDEKGLADDLIYNSPKYPILNITDNQKCLSLGENSIVIQNIINLNELLEYFGYEKKLTFDDIMKIRKKFFNGYFGKNHCELFGMIENVNEDTMSVSYSSVSPCILDRKYFFGLDNLGDDVVGFLLGDCFKANAFKPSKIEGPVRKLKRF